MTRDPETVLLGGLIIVLLMAIALALVFLRRGRSVPEVPSEGQITPEHPQDIVPWVLEGRRLFDLWQERIERLDELKSRLSAMAQEIEQLRAEIGQIGEMRAQIARLGEENERCRAEQDRLRDALTRIATLAHEAAADRPE